MSQPTKPLSTRIGFTLAATGAIYLAPGATQAGIMSMADVGGSPFSGSAASLQATPIAWDVDNDGNFDFQFFGSSGAPLIGVGDAPGNGWVVATANTSSQAINNLPLSFSVGSQAGYAIGATGTSHLLQAVGVFWNAQGFTSGVAGYSGFTFMIGTNQHYGWVEWTHTLATGPGGGLVEVSNWAFEDSPDTPIHLADTSSSVPARPAAWRCWPVVSVGCWPGVGADPPPVQGARSRPEPAPTGSRRPHDPSVHGRPDDWDRQPTFILTNRR